VLKEVKILDIQTISKLKSKPTRAQFRAKLIFDSGGWITLYDLRLMQQRDGTFWVAVSAQKVRDEWYPHYDLSGKLSKEVCDAAVREYTRRGGSQ